MGPSGLATLATVSLHFTNARADAISPALLQATQNAGIDPAMPLPGTPLTFIQAAGFQSTFTEGATHAFLVGSAMILLASLVVWIFLDVKHTELATDGPETVPVV